MDTQALQSVTPGAAIEPVRSQKMLVLIAGAAALVLLVGCGGVKFNDPASKYSPEPAARELFQTHVEEQLGSSWMSQIYDHDSFRKGVQDLGDTACKNALNGHSRNDFQKDFRETGQLARNTSGDSNSQLDTLSLMFWSLAIRDLCPSVGGSQ